MKNKLSSLLTLAVVALLGVPTTSFAGSPPPPPPPPPPLPDSILLSAANFTLLGGTAITSTGVAGTVIISGNIGLSPGDTSAIIGFPPGVVTGGGAIIATGPVTGQARQDLIKAANGLAGMPSNTNLSNVDLGGLTLLPGVYTFDGAATLNGDLVLDADGQNDAFWVFQISTSLTTAINSTVTVINSGTNGGNDDGIFWVAGSAMTIGANNQVLGNYLAGTSLTFSSTTHGSGRALVLAGISLDQNIINSRGGPADSDWSGGLTYDAQGNVVPNSIIFVTDPDDQNLPVGSDATFTVATAGNTTFQWQREKAGTSVYANVTDGEHFAGSNTSTLTVSNTTLAMSGDRYRSVATSFGASASSASALLTVTSLIPVISIQPDSAVIAAFSNVKFHVLAKGPGTLKYSWERNKVKLKNGARVYDSTTATLILRRVQSADAGNYRVVVTNAYGSVTSQSAKLTVK